ncbi:Auxin-responsive GH3 family protein [Raphanus sativus]|nr:Auxin-responsive GH3 family protein [Raphanus sativus]
MGYFSSGTSGGNQKIFPATSILSENIQILFTITSAIMYKCFDGFKQGKVIRFTFTHPISTTPCGLPLAPLITSFTKSACYKSLAKNSPSPDQVILCPDTKQSMYCQLLCGLVQRDEVVSVGAMFASVLVQVIHFLEIYWKELASNIRCGHVSEWITDLSCRDSVSTILVEPNPKLADLIENECGQKSWQGIVSRLWPKAKCIEAIVTGTMAQYIPALEFYSNNELPLVSKVYASSEAFFGVNLEPLSKPQHVSYTFLPNMSYFEFIDVNVDGGTTGEIVDLVNLKLGRYYEILVTNFSGLHRCRVGDVLQVTGFYNMAPQLRFVRRKDTVLSVYVESTTEEDLLKALARATVVLESSDLMYTGFTSYADVSTVPGHYVVYMELRAKVDYNSSTDVLLQLDNKVLVECCCAMEQSFNGAYRLFRSKDEHIGALELRVVQQGTFDSLMKFFLSRGASLAQYKTPMCINSVEALKTLEDKVLARFFSDKSPPV